MSTQEEFYAAVESVVSAAVEAMGDDIKNISMIVGYKDLSATSRSTKPITQVECMAA
ncbi:hypothetical protein [Hwanghaeella sp. 1Z406]|uniref:hypothetical protein n=1 Tax=Hwanghaeella sp. 1Z406 TaxID=3402811 RepID=UPI003B6842EC|tara:strand:+ start:2649 stop:2819 length:171 start_codon:yes stop_codon:yes gene_type:complete